MKEYKLSHLAIITVMSCVFLSVMALGVADAGTGSGSFKKDNEIVISFGMPVDEAWAKNTCTGNCSECKRLNTDKMISTDFL